MLLRCLAIDFPTEQAENLSEQVQEQESAPDQAPKPYTLYNLQGEPLSKADSDYAHKEFRAGRTDPIHLSEDEDPFRTRKIMICTENDLKFEVIMNKEV